MSTTVHQEVIFAAPATRVFEALMDAGQHGAFTGGPAEISREPGGAFSCHGGRVVGRTIELEPNRRIVQAWRGSNWPEGVYSILRIELHDEGGTTRLVMDHEALPDGSQGMIDSSWKTIYWEPLSRFLA